MEEESKEINQEEKNASNIFVTIVLSIVAVMIAFAILFCMGG